MHVHSLSGPVGSPELDEQYRDYFAAIAVSTPAAPATFVRHTLRPDAGEGTIEVTPLHGTLRMTRYDLSHRSDHRVEYDFDDERFELEFCLGGSLHMREHRVGSDDLRASAVSLGPMRPTRGCTINRGGERYRAVSLSGRRRDLHAYVGTLGRAGLGRALQTLDDRASDDLYLGRSVALRAIGRPFAEVFHHRGTGSGRGLFLESRVMASLALLADAADAADGETEDSGAGFGLADHEVAAISRVPGILWDRRYDPLSPAQIARTLSLSQKRLRQGFAALFGTTMSEHHRRRCLAYAAGMLTESDTPIAQIGYEAGYSSPSSFAYAFRREHGCTAAEFRRAHR